jgi:predicted negative regulator of RcsB-dependent stress response|tara:strand:+ start:304 stop:948 length:645 start_codon:yes stop_codon:yes gene_type:complete
MNNVYENNIRFLPLLKFLDKYKILLTSLTILLLGIIVFFVINNQIQDKKSEQASDLYKEWLTIFSEDNPDTVEINKMLKIFLNDYKKTGYTKLALLSKANLDAKLENYEESIKNFKEIIELTNGYSGNKIFNKIARVSASRLLLSSDKYEEALQMLDIYSSSDTNAYIHELMGDILYKQQKNELAMSQYEMAAQKYTDETSKSIISMKISNIDN